MDIISVHQEDMMTVQKHLKGELFAQLVEEAEQLGFAAGLYKIGPTMVSIPTEHFFDDEVDFKVYIPVSEEVDTADMDFESQKSLDIPKAIASRVPFNDKVDDEFRKLRQYLDDNDEPVPDRIFLIMTPVYAEYWVDIVVPLAPVVEK